MIGRILGIGLSEQIELAWEDFDSSKRPHVDQPRNVTVHDLRCDALNLKTPQDVQTLLREVFASLRDDAEYEEIFDGRTTCIALNSIGRIDLRNSELTTIVRKNWKEHQKDDRRYTVSLKDLKDEFFPNVLDKHLIANNDATGVALAEYYYFSPEDRPITMCYITINEGVNVGFLYDGQFLQRLQHPEFGHIFPRPHPLDKKLKLKEACPAHGKCYEALASAARIRHVWNASIPIALCDFSDDHVSWDIISYYIAQLCLTCHAVLAPEKIILGGKVMWGENIDDPECASSKRIEEQLMPRIWQHYLKLRADYPLSQAGFARTIEDRLSEASGLIQRGKIYRSGNALGALALIRARYGGRLKRV